MKKIVLAFVLILFLSNSFGAHIKGGFFTYDYLGPGISDPTKLRYKITLTVYMICGPSAGQLTNPITFTIFQGNTANQIANPSVNITSQYNLSKVNDEPCISGDQRGCYYTVVIYELNNYELPVTADGYTVSYQRCCRINNMDNVVNSVSVGNTWTIKIPGTTSPVIDANKNSSPHFPINDTVVVCAGSFFSYSFQATDPNFDSLSYALCSAYEGGTTTNNSPNPAAPPPYATVPYLNPYSGTQPMGAGVTINPVTGLISGIAPPITNTGEYVITVCVFEYRSGDQFAETRKELHIRVKDCVPLDADLNPQYITCDGFTMSFSNNVALTDPATVYEWNFGDPASGVFNTSSLANPTHTYSDTGVYLLKLKVSIAGLCADSTTALVKVYPGFFPGFIFSQPTCVNVPVQFNDTTRTNYGFVDTWRWDFGNPAVLNDTSHLKNPTYVYTNPGTYVVEFVVTNSKGCIDTVYKNLTIVDRPPMTIFPRDTTYCGLDTLQLSASGVGNFTWTPNYNIIGTNTANPQVYPAVPTRYYVSLNANGCTSTDSLLVTPKFDLSNSIVASSTNVCEEDTITLTGNSNYASNVTWQWSPSATIESPNSRITRAFPVSNITYNLATTWGLHCIANTSVPITVKPLAVPNAGPDTALCSGQGTVQLSASGGATYQWTPATGLSNPNIANPFATPAVTTTYIVSIGVVGCSKRRDDSVVVAVRTLPPLAVTNDTLICSIDTLQLNGTGTGNFTWSPNYMISNVNAANPLVSPDVPTKYYVRLSDAFGCYSLDSVFVDVKLFVTLSAGPDTSVCRTDGFFINTTSDALQYIWTPSTYLDDPTKKRPFATPLTTTTYHVIGNIGKCQSQDDVTIKVAPYPPANAGADTIICPGFSAQLNATGGSSYVWSPATFLNNRFLPNPVSVNPTASIRYIVTVTDTLGCAKSVKDTMFVTVQPKTIADAGPRDTSVVEGQPLQLNATGGVSYLWTPPLWLNNFVIANPIALPLNNIEYIVQATSAAGCKGVDSIRVKVFKVDPDMYVPTAFSPNGDGLNDVFKPILLGMKELTYFRVYNRFGQMVFSTTDIGRGWDGTFGGRGQDPGTFVWMAEGLTYKNIKKQKKGYVVLIRQ